MKTVPFRDIAIGSRFLATLDDDELFTWRKVDAHRCTASTPQGHDYGPVLPLFSMSDEVVPE